MRRTIAAVTAVAAFVAAAGPAAADTPRQMQVERAGAGVMPFDLDATMHHFDPTPRGGVQRVLARTDDAAQVRLVRAHLRKEAAAFARGDLSDPAKIHGRDMPGLQAIEAGARNIAVRYADLPNGGRITYTTRDPALVAAIHAWFKAQVSDHGSHAAMKM